MNKLIFLLSFFFFHAHQKASLLSERNEIDSPKSNFSVNQNLLSSSNLNLSEELEQKEDDAPIENLNLDSLELLRVDQPGSEAHRIFRQIQKNNDYYLGDKSKRNKKQPLVDLNESIDSDQEESKEDGYSDGEQQEMLLVEEDDIQLRNQELDEEQAISRGRALLDMLAYAYRLNYEEKTIVKNRLNFMTCTLLEVESVIKQTIDQRESRRFRYDRKSIAGKLMGARNWFSDRLDTTLRRIEIQPMEFFVENVIALGIGAFGLLVMGPKILRIVDKARMIN